MGSPCNKEIFVKLMRDWFRNDILPIFDSLFGYSRRMIRRIFNIFRGIKYVVQGNRQQQIL